MIKAVLFDCFGVLAENGWGLIDDQLSPSNEQWQQMSAISHSCDRGLISLDELKIGFAEVLGVDPARIDHIITNQKKNYPLLEYIKSNLKSHFQLAIVSNVGRGFIQEFFNDSELAMFDEVILSSEVGSVKPEPAIYKFASYRLGVTLPECVFIDDSAINVDAAQDLGMPSILYTDFASLKQQLKANL